MKKLIILDILAGMIQKGFEETATKAEMNSRFEEVDNRFTEVDNRFEKIDERFNKIDDDIRYIHGSLDLIRQEVTEIKTKLGHVVYQDELENLRRRVEKLEKKLSR